MAARPFSLITSAYAESDSIYVNQAISWMEASMEMALPGIRARLDDSPPPNKVALHCSDAPRGAPHSLCGVLIARRKLRGNKRVSFYSREEWRKLLSLIHAGLHSVELEISELDANGMAGDGMVRIGVYRLEQNPSWIEFSISMTPPLLDGAESTEVQTAWLRFLEQQANVQRSSFGNIADDNSYTDTALEVNLGRSAFDTIPESVEVLRGYSWVTVCSREISGQLGGAAELRRSGAFEEVIQLTHGGLLLRATQTYKEYCSESISRVFEALAPVLLRGRTSPINRYEQKLIYGVDAADYQ